MNDSGTARDGQRLLKLSREHARLQPVMAEYERFKLLRKERAD